MIRKHPLCSVVGFVLLAILPSCMNEDDSSDLLTPTALVTVCPNADGSFVMQLDNTTRLVPTNMKTSPFGAKEVRALVSYTETVASSRAKTILNVAVHRIDSIRTKKPVESLGGPNDSRYGDDPVEIVKDWVTVAEDGYLTLRGRTRWGAKQSAHILNLVTGTNPDDPYELELRHNAQGEINGHWGDALIAFNLNGLPRTGIAGCGDSVQKPEGDREQRARGKGRRDKSRREQRKPQCTTPQTPAPEVQQATAADAAQQPAAEKCRPKRHKKRYGNKPRKAAPDAASGATSDGRQQ